MQIATLDGRTIALPVRDILTPSSAKLVKGEGMPISKEPGQKGDLLVKFDIQFPRSLTADQKAQLRALLGEQEEYNL